MIGRDDPSKVLAWIEERITCHIPDQENNPELHNLVTRYQLHKCSNYCTRKRINDDCGDSNAGKLCTEDPVSVSRQFHLSSMPSSTQLLLGTETTFTGKKSIRHVEHLTITCSCGYVMHQ